jgi:hypothetical protein
MSCIELVCCRSFRGVCPSRDASFAKVCESVSTLCLRESCPPRVHQLVSPRLHVLLRPASAESSW